MLKCDLQYAQLGGCGLGRMLFSVVVLTKGDKRNCEVNKDDTELVSGGTVFVLGHPR